MRYLHTMVRVKDLEDSMAFYRLLGLEETRRYDSKEGRFTLVFMAPPGQPECPVELTYNWDGDDGLPSDSRHFGHLAYEVDDIYAKCAALQAAGVTINRPPRDGRMAFVRSPDNISVELLQRPCATGAGTLGIDAQRGALVGAWRAVRWQAGGRGVALALLAVLAGAPATAQCRLALALGMDVSASVDAREYALMMGGTARALLSDPVRAALFDDLPVALAAYVWAGRREQAVAVQWTLIDSNAALEDFAAQLARYPRPRGDPIAGWGGMTAVGAALMAGQSLLARAPDCFAQTLDIAGDGINNDGPEPGPLRAQLGEITVNALAVSGALYPGHVDYDPAAPPLAEWMRAQVIHGAGAFVEPADGYDDFQRAMQRKLERELAPPLLGYLPR